MLLSKIYRDMSSPTRTATYDYVVVGAGSAGCVLANRLSSDSDTTVLVLEAGEPDDKREIRIPAAFSDLFRTETDWEYYTEPQAEMHDREEYWPRGKTLGGSSSINAMIHIRGHPYDYDRWTDLGNKGWAYEDILPYFKRSEHFAGNGGDPEYHGTDGPLHVADQRSPRDLSKAFVDAATEVDYEHNTDFNGECQEGIGLYHVTQKDGRRHSAADAYLTPVLDRPNLTVETGAYVTRVLLEDDRAVGAAYEQGGRRLRADATEEVLVCGGTVNSPQLLMLSGIGPADHLREHDIGIQQELPGVGRNLQDHLIVPVVYEATTAATLDDADSLTRLPVNMAKFFFLKRGPLTSNIGESGGFVRTDEDLPAPDIQFIFAPTYFMNHGFDNPKQGHGFSIGATQLRPESRGRITLRSADPFEVPAIDPQYFTDPADLDALVEGIRRIREIVRASPFDEYRDKEIWPGEDVESDDEIAEHIRETAQTVYHPVGTCKMGDDDLAVVDDRLRVHGVKGLRVIDGSIVPRLVGGNTNAPIIMIAERATDFIRGVE